MALLRRLRVLGLVTAFPVLGACGATRPTDSAKSAAASSLAIERHESIAPGKGLEVDLTFEAGAEATAVFNATGGTFAWNVHSHPDGGVVIHDKGDGSVGSFSFRAKTAGVYSFAWTNIGAQPAALAVKVTGDPAIREWVRPAN
jgi:hypothetical protein